MDVTVVYGFIKILDLLNIYKYLSHKFNYYYYYNINLRRNSYCLG